MRRRLLALLRLCFVLIAASACNLPTGTPVISSPTASTIQTAFAIATITGAAYTPLSGPVFPLPPASNATGTPGIPVTGSTPPPATTAMPWPLLQAGNQGPEVFALQCLLRQHGQEVPVNGTFETETQRAVANFQADSGLPTNGIVDDKTFPALIQMKSVQQGQKGFAVRAVQQLLHAKFGYPITVNDNFNGETDAAVRDFQASHNLVVDGLVGPQTWRALFSLSP